MNNALQDSPSRIEVEEHLYDIKAKFTHVVSFGIKIQNLLSNPEIMPPQGARFNFEFEGEVKGDRLNGKIKGVDYGYIRPDGVAKLHIHAVITTDTGVHLSLNADGTTFQSDDPSIYKMRENVTLFTEDPQYKWVNRLQCWATGFSDLTKGEINLSVFIA